MLTAPMAASSRSDAITAPSQRGSHVSRDADAFDAELRKAEHDFDGDAAHRDRELQQLREALLRERVRADEAERVAAAEAELNGMSPLKQRPGAGARSAGGRPGAWAAHGGQAAEGKGQEVEPVLEPRVGHTRRLEHREPNAPDVSPEHQEPQPSNA